MILPSWRPGAARDRLVALLDASEEIPEEERLAVFDNDGTLWCERPHYVQEAFLIDALARRAAEDPALREREEFRALLDADAEAIGRIGMVRIAVALMELFAGQDPRDYTSESRAFAERWVHPTLGVRCEGLVYLPMLELLEELRRRGWTIGIVSGGGVEFVRAVSRRLYGVPPELVVGSVIEHELTDDGELRRTAKILGAVNEGATKVMNLQGALGRRPRFAAGNSGGDTEMLAWTAAGGGLALVLEHDDAEREFAYEGRAESFAQAESLGDTARREGWAVVSMRDDWDRVFPPAG